MAWLDRNRPRRSQFRRPRRAQVRGVCVVHTAENGWPSSGAAGVAAFIQGRKDPGSYHWLVDQATRIQLVDWDAEAFQDGTGSNPWAYGLSCACRTTDWRRMTAAQKAGFINNLADGSAAANAHSLARAGIRIPARRITRAQSNAGVPGFISHAERDPARRSDPGRDFPWTQFLDAHRARTTAPAPGGPPAPPKPPARKDWLSMATEAQVSKIVADQVTRAVTEIRRSRPWLIRDYRTNHVWLVAGGTRRHVRTMRALNILVFTGQAGEGVVAGNTAEWHKFIDDLDVV